MPRPAKSARLWLRPAGRDRARLRPAEWIILDRGKQIRTGCGPAESGAAERELARYLAEKYEPPRRRRDPDQISIADVLSVYLDDRPPLTDPIAARRFAGRCERLLAFWGERKLSEVNVRTCQAYAADRARAARRGSGGRSGSAGGARRDLEDLRAAIAHHLDKGLHAGRVTVWLPDKGQPRTRWLTRDEVAALLWACWRTKEQRTRRSDGRQAAGGRYTLRHLARFMLLGLYTGTRASAIASASFAASSGRSYVDLDRGLFFRLAAGRKETKKRQPPMPLPPRLLAHMRRWSRIDAAAGGATGHVVEYRGKPIMSVKNGFSRAVRLAGVEGPVTPHTLRHTAATWLRMNGVSQFEAAGLLGMSIQMLNRIYAHQDELNLTHAAAALGARPGNATAMKRGSIREPKQNKAG